MFRLAPIPKNNGFYWVLLVVIYTKMVIWTATSWISMTKLHFPSKKSLNMWSVKIDLYKPTQSSEPNKANKVTFIKVTFIKAWYQKHSFNNLGCHQPNLTFKILKNKVDQLRSNWPTARQPQKFRVTGGSAPEVDTTCCFNVQYLKCIFLKVG